MGDAWLELSEIASKGLKLCEILIGYRNFLTNRVLKVENTVLWEEVDLQ